MNKQIKKLFALILCFSFAFSTISFAEDDIANGFEPSEYSEAVSMLTDLGIIDSSSFLNYDTSLIMTRGEFASFAIALMGLTDEAHSAAYTEIFKDVPADNKYAKEINFSASIGLFSGISESEFAPDEPIYVMPAIKVAVSMLGYNEMAKHTGGYPAGYYSIAQKLNLLDGVVTNTDEPALRGNIIVLMYNTLFADVMSVSGVYGDAFSYDITEGVTLLSYCHKIYEYEGIVTANWQYSISGNTEEANTVMINGTRYFTESSRALHSVGKNVKYYVKSVYGKDILLTLREEHNKIVSIDSNENYSFDYNLGRYTVKGDNKDYVFNLSDYDIVYNYASIDGDTIIDYEDLLTPLSGTVTLIDNNEDNLYDVVIIEEASILLFNTYDSYSEKIYDIKDRSRDIAYDDYDRVAIRDINGNEVDMSKLAANTVIMVYKSHNNKSVNMVVCSAYIEGRVDEINSEGVVIGDNTYKFSPVSRLGATHKESIYPGQSYKFYLDQYNRIVYHDTKSTSNTGYLVDIANNTSSGLNSKIYAMMYTTSSQLMEIPFAYKVKIETINGINSYSANQIEAELSTFVSTIYSDGVNPNSRLFIQYTLNNDKEISQITLPYLIDNETEYNNPPSNYSFFKVDYILQKFVGPGFAYPNNDPNPIYHRLAYVPSNKSAGLTMTMDDSCYIYYVPEFSNIEYTESNFAYKAVSSLAKDTPLYHYVNFDGKENQLEAYSTDRELRLINNLVWIKKNGHATPIENMCDDNALVTGVKTTVNENGDTLIKISVLESKSQYDIYSNNLNILSRSIFEDTKLEGYKNGLIAPTIASGKNTIVPGDIIRFSKNAEGYVEDIALMYDSENNIVSYQSPDDFTKHTVRYRHTCGDVVDMYGNYSMLSVYNESFATRTLEPHIISSYFRIYVYDYKTKEARVGTADDISIGDKVYLTMYFSSSRDGEIVIYKGGNR